MKILYVTSGPENVGTFFRAFFFAKELVKLGNDVTLLCSHSSPSSKLNLSINRDGVQILSYIRTKTRWDYMGFLLRGLLYSIHAIKNNYDVVHVYIPWQPPSFAVVFFTKLKKIFGSNTKLILDWDDYWGGDGISVEHHPFLNSLITYCEGRVNSVADKVTVCSDFLKNKCISAGINDSKIFKIYNGSDVDTIYPIDRATARNYTNLQPNCVSCLLIGQFQTSAFPKVIKLVSEYCCNYNKIQLYVLGALPIEYENLVNEHSDCIKFLGKVKHSELKYYFSSVDFLILPMDNSSIEMARFPIRFGDYIASGTPVLAAPHGEIEKLIDETGCCVKFDIDNLSEFVKAVNLIDDSELLAQYLHNANKLSKSISWSSVSYEMVKVYRA